MGASQCIHVLKTLMVFFTLLLNALSQHAWDKPGCHRVGFTRTISIPGCVKFQVTTNACRGYCVSYAIPSSKNVLRYNPGHIVTSRAECCGISETHDVKVNVRCLNGFRQLTFKSAATCACSTCRKG